MAALALATSGWRCAAAIVDVSDESVTLQKKVQLQLCNSWKEGQQIVTPILTLTILSFS